jgi:hypothetical protein
VNDLTAAFVCIAIGLAFGNGLMWLYEASRRQHLAFSAIFLAAILLCMGKNTLEARTSHRLLLEAPASK